MNRRLVFTILSAAAGIAAGWLAGRSTPHAAPATDEPAVVASRPSPRHRTTAAAEATPPRDFASYVKRVAKPSEVEEAEEAAGRMSSDELRELLLSVPDINWRGGSAFTPRGFVLYRASDAIGAELVRREGSAAIDWATRAGKKSAFAAVLRALCATEPKEAKKHMLTYFTTFADGGTGWEFSAAHVNAAALKNPAELVEAQKLWDNTGLDSIPVFAADFDFAAFYAKTDLSRPAALPFVAWVGRDPEAAATAIRQGALGHEWDQVLGKALQARALLAGEAEAARWMVAALGNASGHDRTMGIGSLANDITPARAVALMEALPKDRDRIDLALSAISSGFNGAEGYLHPLRALPTEELRVQTLTEAFTGKSPRPSWTARGTREERIAKLTPIMDKLQISAAGRQQLLTAMPAE